MSSRTAGQIIRRGDRKWLIRVYKGTDPATGKRQYRNKTVHGTKTDAQNELNSMLRKKTSRSQDEAAKASLGEYLDRWLDASRKRLRPRTLSDYKRFLDAYVRPKLGKVPLDRLEAIGIQEVYTTLGEEVSGHAVRSTHLALNAALNQAVRWGALDVNPCKGVSIPPEVRRPMSVLSPTEAAAFQREAEKHRRGFIFSFTLATGLRPGEVQGLQWRDVDHQERTITVRRAVAWLPGDKWQFGQPKTRKSLRTIPLPRSVADRLRIHQREQAVDHSRRRKRGREIADHTLVFPDRNGNPMHGKNLAVRVLKPILAEAKLDPRFRWYDCRHTCATLLLAAGENPKVVSERLGHATVAFTLDRYAHVLPGMQERATERLEAILFGSE